jgi:small subunit ribosomal protein S5
VADLNKSSSGPSRGGGGGRGPNRGPRRARPGSPEGSGTEPTLEGGGGSELSEKVVFINRSAKVVKGGRRFSFSALVVAGDKHGRIGLGLGKAVEVSEAIRKGGEMAKQRMIHVSLKEATIPHEVFCSYGGAKVLLRPASPGTGIIAGPKVRAVLEAAGIKDILSKSLGSNNPSNVVKATMEGLQRLRTLETIYRGRGMEVKTPKAPTVAPVAQAAPVVPVAPVAPVAPVPPPAPPAGDVPPPANA